MPGPKILFYMWTARPWLENLPTGKRPGGDCLGQQSSLSVSPQLVTVATVRNNTAVIIGKVGDVVVKIMLDTGSGCCREANSMYTQPSSQGCSLIQLVTASGESLPIISCVEAPVQMTDDFMVKHRFLIVDSIINLSSHTWNQFSL